MQVLDWNLVLDERGGPNHVNNFCDAPYLFDTSANKLMERELLSYLWHFSHFVEPGFVRIGLSRYTDTIEAAAFAKEDKIVVVLLNRTSKALMAYLRIGNSCAPIVLKPQSISSGVIE